MSWFEDVLSGGDEANEEESPAERILQLRRGVSAAAESLPEERRAAARAAVEAADALADRVAEIVETPGPEEGVDVDASESDVDAAGWLREGPARRREAGGPAGSEVAAARGLPAEVAREGAEHLDRLHFALLRVEILGEVPEAVSLEEEISAVRSLSRRLDGGAGGEDGAGAGAGGGASPAAGEEGG